MPASPAHYVALWAVLVMMPFASAYAASEQPRQFAFGLEHRCALTAAGAVQCLGESNSAGQVGDGVKDGRPVLRPVQVIAGGATKIATGDYFSCAIVDTALDCWGDIPVPGGTAARPTRVIASGVTDLAAGARHVCAIVNGAALCWGANFSGQSGNDDLRFIQETPWTAVAGGVTAIAAGSAHSCAVAAGALVCWGRAPGSEDAARAGSPKRKHKKGSGDADALPPAQAKETDAAVTVPPAQPLPEAPLFARGVTGVAAGSNYTCAIVDSALWCWGSNDGGALGIGAGIPAAASPVKVIAGGVSAVVARFRKTCAIVNGALQCWGTSETFSPDAAPPEFGVQEPRTVVASGVSFVAIGANRSCALVDGALRCSDQGRFDSTDSPFGVSDMLAREGVWRGTLGDQQIMVCLVSEPGRANYYYVRHGRGILLTAAEEHGGLWHEGAREAPTASWTLRPVQGEHLDGEWADANHKRRLPIHLERIGPAAGCGGGDGESAAYDAPRVSAQKLTVTETADHYRTVSVLGGAISMVELPETVAHAARFNAAMLSWLQEQIVAYFGCALAPAEIDFRSHSEIDWSAGDLVMVRELTDVYCGGAHPSGGVAYHTWSLARGEMIEPWTWIRGAKNGDEYAAPPKLNKIIIGDPAGAQEECRSEVLRNNHYTLRPTPGGLAFSSSYAHAIQSCNDDTIVPYAKLAPFLTPEGKIAVAALQKAQPSTPK